MAQTTAPGNYTQGYSDHTISTHLSRTAQSNAAFLIPHIKPTAHILDLGCGPGTITTGIAQCAPQGTTLGVDMSADIIARATTLAAEAHIPTSGPGCVTFEVGNVLHGLRFADATFDVVYCSQVMGHIPLRDPAVRALREIRRVLKPGGVFATRDGLVQHFFPPHLAINRLWPANQLRALHKGDADAVATAAIMPALLREAGFDVEGGKVVVGTNSNAVSGVERRRFYARRAAGQLREGDAFYRSWVDAGITEAEIRETVRAAEEWAETEDAWFVSVERDQQRGEVEAGAEVLEHPVAGDVDADVRHVEDGEGDVEVGAGEVGGFGEAGDFGVADVGAVEEGEQPDAKQDGDDASVEFPTDARLQGWVDWVSVVFMRITDGYIMVAVLRQISLVFLRGRVVHGGTASGLVDQNMNPGEWLLRRLEVLVSLYGKSAALRCPTVAKCIVRQTVASAWLQ